MLNREIVQAWLDEAETTLAYGEGPVVPDGVESLDASECDELLARLAVAARAVRFLQDCARRRFVDHLGTSGFARFGDRVYRAGPDRKETLRAERRSEWYRLIEGSGMVAEVFPAYSARKGGLRAVAEGYVNRETGELGWPAFLADFYDVEVGDVKVVEVPVSKAPQFLQRLEDGTVEYRGDAA